MCLNYIWLSARCCIQYAGRQTEDTNLVGHLYSGSGPAAENVREQLQCFCCSTGCEIAWKGCQKFHSFAGRRIGQRAPFDHASVATSACGNACANFHRDREGARAPQRLPFGYPKEYITAQSMGFCRGTDRKQRKSAKSTSPNMCNGALEIAWSSSFGRAAILSDFEDRGFSHDVCS